MKTPFMVGLLALALAIPVMADSATTKPDADAKVKLSDCPQVVQDTLKTAVGAGTIKQIETENEDGKSVYSADATIDGKPYEIKISPDGKLLKKELDNDDEKEGKKGEHEDDDKK